MSPDSVMTAESTTGSILNPKQSCRLGIWNVRTMFEASRAAQVERESLWTGYEALTRASRNYIVHSSRDDGKHREGVAIMMSDRKSVV